MNIRNVFNYIHPSIYLSSHYLSTAKKLSNHSFIFHSMSGNYFNQLLYVSSGFIPNKEVSIIVFIAHHTECNTAWQITQNVW